MLRPSATMASMAGTPAVGGGDLDQQVGLADAFVQVAGGRRWSPRVSCASSGATSIETNPSAPSLASKVGRNSSRASMTSVMTRSQ